MRRASGRGAGWPAVRVAGPEPADTVGRQLAATDRGGGRERCAGPRDGVNDRRRRGCARVGRTDAPASDRRCGRPGAVPRGGAAGARGGRGPASFGGRAALEVGRYAGRHRPAARRGEHAPRRRCACVGDADATASDRRYGCSEPAAALGGRGCVALAAALGGRGCAAPAAARGGGGVLRRPRRGAAGGVLRRPRRGAAGGVLRRLAGGEQASRLRLLAAADEGRPRRGPAPALSAPGSTSAARGSAGGAGAEKGRGARLGRRNGGARPAPGACDMRGAAVWMPRVRRRGSGRLEAQCVERDEREEQVGGAAQPRAALVCGVRRRGHVAGGVGVRRGTAAGAVRGALGAGEHVFAERRRGRGRHGGAAGRQPSAFPMATRFVVQARLQAAVRPRALRRSSRVRTRRRSSCARARRPRR